ncbi:MAG: RNA 2',3'-cyclic phosphodiesterase [Dehalococcoidia bacterium]|nr:RNA 2',3'-cyclic phosphodiesterase [Dehalococcoidia bacterium]
MSNEQIRSFIAIELPEEVKAGLRRLQTELKLPQHSFVKWVATGSIHLTLKFLGNISASKVADITSVMEQASQGVSPFQLEVTEVGAFPNLRQPRVLWVGIKGEVDKLVGWQQRIDKGLLPLGFARETRPFTPHLTLARLREGVSPGDRRDFGEMVAKTPAELSYKFNVTSLSLMKSQLLPGGAVYSRLAEVKLKS